MESKTLIYRECVMKCIRSYLAVILLICFGLLQAQSKPLEQDTSNIGTTSIIHSSPIANDTVTIRYNQTDSTIVSIVHNGKEISENRYYEYAPYLITIWEHKTIRSAIPNFDELTKLLDSPGISDEIKMGKLNQALNVLEDMESSLAKTYSDRLYGYKENLALDFIRVEFRKELNKIGIIHHNGVKEIKIESDICYVDGEKMPMEATQIFKKIYKEYKGLTVNKSETIHIEFDD